MKNEQSIESTDIVADIRANIAKLTIAHSLVEQAPQPDIDAGAILVDLAV